MKSMNIAASSELVSRLSSHRRVVALGDTDFTDVAAVVITAADSRSGILTLLKRTGFHLPVFLYSEHAVELPADAPRDKCTLSCAINGIHAAFHYLKKNYISGCVMTVPTG